MQLEKTKHVRHLEHESFQGLSFSLPLELGGKKRHPENKVVELAFVKDECFEVRKS